MKKIVLALILLLSATSSAYAQHMQFPMYGAAADTSDVTLTGTTTLVGGATIGESLGPELVTLDATCTGWTIPAGWACVAGVLTHNADGASAAESPSVLTLGVTYKFVWTYTQTAAPNVAVAIAANTNISSTKTAAGTYTDYLTAGAGTTIRVYPMSSTFRGVITALSVRAVTSTVTPASGHVIVQKTFADATANEAGLVINTNQTGAGGDKTSLEINQTGSGTGTEYLIKANAEGTIKFSVTNAGIMSNIILGTAAQISTASYFTLQQGTNQGMYLGYGLAHTTGGAGFVQIAASNYTATSGTTRAVIVGPTFGSPTGNMDGTYIAASIEPTYNQTATGGSSEAANIDLRISRIETALGSGAQKFISLQSGAAGTTEMYAISNKGIITESISAAVTADAGSAQGGSPLTSSLNVITVVATAGDSVTLPAAAAGVRITITNRDATDSADVFPATDDSINGAAANAAKALAAAASMMCYAVDGTSWECLTLAR